jgi:hypothetical protein
MAVGFAAQRWFGQQLAMDQYEELEVIGTGAFGKVCKIRRKCDNKVSSIDPHLGSIHPLSDFGLERTELWINERTRKATACG